MVCRNARDESAAIDRWVFNYINYSYSWSCLSNYNPTGLAISSIDWLLDGIMHPGKTTRMPVISIAPGVQIMNFIWGVSKYAKIILVVKASLGIKHQEIVCHCIPPLPFNPRTYRERGWHRPPPPPPPPPGPSEGFSNILKTRFTNLLLGAETFSSCSFLYGENFAMCVCHFCRCHENRKFHIGLAKN